MGTLFTHWGEDRGRSHLHECVCVCDREEGIKGCLEVSKNKKKGTEVLLHVWNMTRNRSFGENKITPRKVWRKI